MVPVSIMFVVIGSILCAIAGLAIGALTGWLISLMTKCGSNGVLRDAFLGSFGFLVGYFGCVLMPWPRNTVVESLAGGGTVATTMNTYQHPARIAIAVAVFAPLLHELYRFKRAHTELG